MASSSESHGTHDLNAAPALPAPDGLVERDTHLLEWLDDAYVHCQHGSQDWCESYLHNAGAVIRSQDTVIQTLQRERDAAVAALNSIVNMQSSVTRAQFREAAADALESIGCKPIGMTDQSPFIIRAEAAESEVIRLTEENEALRKERDALRGERDAAFREAQDKDIRYRTWREFYGALLAVPASSATPLEVRAHRQANIITDMQYRIKCLRQEIRRHIRRDHLDPPMKGYRIGQHVNKLHKWWRDAEARAEAAEQQVRDMLYALNWALGTTGEFRPSGVGIGPFWWRAELAARAGLTFDRETCTYRLLLKEGGE